MEDGFSIATEESITVIDDDAPPDDMGDVEIIPGIEEWDVIESSTVVVNPHDEQVKVDEIAGERAKDTEAVVGE